MCSRSGQGGEGGGESCSSVQRARGRCPVESGQETISLPAASPGITSACLHTWQELQASGKLAGPQRSGAEAKRPVWAMGQTWPESM